jgi:hypothetical protein
VCGLRTDSHDRPQSETLYTLERVYCVYQRSAINPQQTQAIMRRVEFWVYSFGRPPYHLDLWQIYALHVPIS